MSELIENGFEAESKQKAILIRLIN